jgi:hypothetical protein
VAMALDLPGGEDTKLVLLHYTLSTGNIQFSQGQLLEGGG